MEKNLENPLTIQVLASECGVSATTLKEAFSAEFGVAPYTWYRAHRMRHAAGLLLTTDLAIGEISRAVGYANASKFSAAFAAEKGMTPSAWRASHAGDPAALSGDPN